MKISNFTKGIISSSSGSFFWGFFGTIYFQYISFIGFFEVVVHRSIWTLLILIITTTFFKKWGVFKKILFDKKKLLILFITGILILSNWTLWIYAVSNNKIIDASFGYFIFPILSVLLGFLFLKEKLNAKRIISILLDETAYIHNVQFPNIKIPVINNNVIFFISLNTSLKIFHFLKSVVVINNITKVQIDL